MLTSNLTDVAIGRDGSYSIRVHGDLCSSFRPCRVDLYRYNLLGRHCRTTGDVVRMTFDVRSRFAVNKLKEVLTTSYRAIGVVKVELQIFSGRKTDVTAELQAGISRASYTKRQGDSLELLARRDAKAISIIGLLTNAVFPAHIDATTKSNINRTSRACCCDCCEARARNQKFFHFLCSNLEHSVATMRKIMRPSVLASTYSTVTRLTATDVAPAEIKSETLPQSHT